MSMRMSNYERKLANEIQIYVKKSEAEDAIIELRELINGSNRAYDFIEPIHMADNSGRVRDVYPSIKGLANAYLEGYVEEYLQNKGFLKEPIENGLEL